MSDDRNPFVDLKGSLTFYFILALAIFSIVGISIYLSSCTSFYDSECDKKIFIEKDGQLYKVNPDYGIN